MSQAEFPSLDLKKLLTVENLPAMPQTALRLLELSKEPANGPAEFAVPLEADPGLSVQVLRFVNSSHFGFRDKISSVRRAITLVGVRAVKNFAMWNAVFSTIPNPRCEMFDLKGMWQDSLRRALFARMLSRLLGAPDAEEAFAAALLQDMAVPLLAKEVPQAYNTLFNARRTSHNRVRLSQLEQHVFGWNHAEAAGIMVREWDLPEVLSTLVAEHLTADEQLAKGHPEPAKLAVAISAYLPAVDDPNWAEFPKFEAMYEQIRPMDGPSVEDLLGRIDEEFAEMAPLLRLTPPRTTLKSSFRQLLAGTTG